MNRRPKLDMKSAFKALQVNQSLKLSTEGPGLRAPSVGAAQTEAPRNEVPLDGVTENKLAQNESPQVEASFIEKSQIETPQIEQPQFEDAHIEHPQTELSQFGLPQNQAPQTELPRNEQPQKAISLTEDARTQVPPIELAQVKQARNENPRPERPHTEETQTKLAHIEEPSFELAPTGAGGGYFKLSHRVFSTPVLQKLPGDCFRLYLWMSSRGWRFPTSNGELRASVRFMEDLTGLGHATVSRSLKTLREAGLIALVETDYKNGNLWFVTPLACDQRGPDDLPPRNERPQNEDTQKGQPASSKRESHSLKKREERPQNECNIRSIKNIKNNSQEEKKILLVLANPHNTEEETDPELSQKALEKFDAEVSRAEHVASH